MPTAVSREFRLQMDGYGLTTAEIHYHLPDHPSLLQLYVWQDCDLAPDFPALKDFLGFWRRELAARLHSVRVAHHRLIRQSEWRSVDGIIASMPNKGRPHHAVVSSSLFICLPARTRRRQFSRP